MPSFTVFKGSKDGDVKKATSVRPDELQGDQVVVRITCSGICGTDLHYQGQDMALGHEGVGIVEALGSECRVLQKGDRVGWGYVHDSCGHCDECLRGTEMYCPERAVYGLANLDQGSFGSHAVWREAFLFKIPNDLSDEAAAPLQCGGATVFYALRANDAQPTETVGIMGIGGLGHLAIEFAAKMGYRIVVLSRTASKKEEALRLGAHEFIDTKNLKEIRVSQRINRLLVTTSAQPDWNMILPILAPGAWIHPLSVSGGNFEIPYMPVLINGITVQWSVVAPRYIHRQMLEFAALHNITPITETFPMTEEGIKDAMDRLEHGDMLFRAVLKA